MSGADGSILCPFDSKNLRYACLSSSVFTVYTSSRKPLQCSPDASADSGRSIMVHYHNAGAFTIQPQRQTPPVPVIPGPVIVARPDTASVRFLRPVSPGRAFRYRISQATSMSTAFSSITSTWQYLDRARSTAHSTSFSLTPLSSNFRRA
jgi:hypothetical protein